MVLSSLPKVELLKTSAKDSPKALVHLNKAISNGIRLISSQQSEKSYWWYTLEANESINAEFIFLMHYLGEVDTKIQKALANRLLASQQSDGSWPLYFDGPGDLSTTVEAYLALKLAKTSVTSEALTKARQFILDQGGISKVRIFTRIHLALFGLTPWEACPSMPVSLISLPNWGTVNIYEFSSWARASIVPLLIVCNEKKTRHLPGNFLEELYIENNPKEVKWPLPNKNGLFSWNNFFVQLDKIIKLGESWSINPFEKTSVAKCEKWIREHIEHTEDIYPALAYAAMALYSLGYSTKDPTIQKCLKALKSFQTWTNDELTALPQKKSQATPTTYQQCCISPVWDTAWAGLALIESGLSPSSEKLTSCARWLLSKQVLANNGDWAVKNKKGLPGGWSFEFQNSYFPDVDDTLQVLDFLIRVQLPEAEKSKAIQRGVDWIYSMQSKNGGWAAFDVNNTLTLVNNIPFSDHGACLDPPTADITGRVVEFFANHDYLDNRIAIKKAVKFLLKTQEKNGSWWGRWGVNYLYGTWCAVQGLASLDLKKFKEPIAKAIKWLESIQNSDGGFGESCESYDKNQYVPTHFSTPSQTAWALMTFIAAGRATSIEAYRAAKYLVDFQNVNGGWNEHHHTGTGFPGHFYIRYHGYRYYFPQLALAKYKKATTTN